MVCQEPEGTWEEWRQRGLLDGYHNRELNPPEGWKDHPFSMLYRDCWREGFRQRLRDMREGTFDPKQETI